MVLSFATISNFQNIHKSCARKPRSSSQLELCRRNGNNTERAQWIPRYRLSSTAAHKRVSSYGLFLKIAFHFRWPLETPGSLGAQTFGCQSFSNSVRATNAKMKQTRLKQWIPTIKQHFNDNDGVGTPPTSAHEGRP